MRDKEVHGDILTVHVQVYHLLHFSRLPVCVEVGVQLERGEREEERGEREEREGGERGEGEEEEGRGEREEEEGGERERG